MPTEIINIDYTSRDLPASVRLFKPVVYLEDTRYRCLLGPKHAEGVSGSGSTLNDALADWDLHFCTELAALPRRIGIVRYMREKLDTARK